MRTWAMATGMAAMAGMAAIPVAAQRPVETIAYEATACFGACPQFRMTVSSDGRGTFEGVRFTRTTGARAFRVSHAQFSEFRRRLEPYHPHGTVAMNDKPFCEQMATDMPSVEVRWSGATRPARLVAYFGCDMQKNRRMFDAIAHAPEALPIREMIGKR